jgi:hypothetical protein
MKRTPILILVFSLAFLVFFIGPPFLGQQFTPYSLMKNGDVLDLLTPLVLIPLYWLLFRLVEKETACRCAVVSFVVLSALWAEGQGMHLSANSIGHLVEKLKGTEAYALTYFYDEILSHYMWHLGIIGLSALLIFLSWRSQASEKSPLLWLIILSGVIHGFTLFMIVIEGGTAPVGIPFAVIATVFGLVWGRKKLGSQPLLLFFTVSYAVATLFFAGWGIYWGGLPQFSELGII